MNNKINIGTSGFSFPDWRKGVVYPKGVPQKEELIYYSRELAFDTLEINSTYYALMQEKTASAMEKKTPDDFTFVVKGFRGFTHDPFDPRIKENRPGIDNAMKNIELFSLSLKPFSDAGKLGCVLLQFPVFFTPSKRSEEYILECKKAFKNIPLVIEFRHVAWANDQTYDFLKKHNIGYCSVDEPALPKLMPFNNIVTSDIAYFRLHGRNMNWFNAPREVRYDYLYSDKELEEFVPQIEKMVKYASSGAFVFFNNCHAGSAVKNASKMREMLGGPSATLF